MSFYLANLVTVTGIILTNDNDVTRCLLNKVIHMPKFTNKAK